MGRRWDGKRKKGQFAAKGCGCGRRYKGTLLCPFQASSQCTGNPGLHRGALSPSAWSRLGHNDTPVDEDCPDGHRVTGLVGRRQGRGTFWTFGIARSQCVRERFLAHFAVLQNEACICELWAKGTEERLDGEQARAGVFRGLAELCPGGCSARQKVFIQQTWQNVAGHKAVGTAVEEDQLSQ